MSYPIPKPDQYQEMREALRDLCGSFDSAYWQKIDHERGYPEAFVDAMTKAGWLAALIPEEYGGSGLGLAARAVHEVRHEALHGRRQDAALAVQDGQRTRHAAVAQAEHDERALLDFLADGAFGDERHAGVDFHRALERLDVVELHGGLELDALLAEELVERLARRDVLVEADELATLQVGEVDDRTGMLPDPKFPHGPNWGWATRQFVPGSERFYELARAPRALRSYQLTDREYGPRREDFLLVDLETAA